MSSFPSTELKNVIGRARQTQAYAEILAGISPAHEFFSEQVWKNLPLTTKKDLRQAYPFGFLAVPRRDLSTFHESSGTTGQPVASFFTDSDWNDIHTRFLRNRIALNADDTVLVKTPYSLVTTAHQMHGAARLAGATVVPGDNRSSNIPYSRVLRLLKDLSVTVAWCLPTEAWLWAYLLRRTGYKLRDFSNLRAFCVAGEVLSPAKKQKLSELWDGKLIAEDYGSTETGSLAGECEQGHLHFWSDRVFPELTEENTLVVTPLYREAMPLIRYHMEDQVRLLTEPCLCGSKLPRIEVLGRKGSGVLFDGREFQSRDIENAIYSSRVDEPIWFWKARPNGRELEIQFFTDSANDWAIADEIEVSFRRQLGIRVSAQAGSEAEFVPSAWLKKELPMQKPKYIYAVHEDWSSIDKKESYEKSNIG